MAGPRAMQCPVQSEPQRRRLHGRHPRWATEATPRAVEDRSRARALSARCPRSWGFLLTGCEPWCSTIAGSMRPPPASAPVSDCRPRAMLRDPGMSQSSRTAQGAVACPPHVTADRHRIDQPVGRRVVDLARGWRGVSPRGRWTHHWSRVAEAWVPCCVPTSRSGSRELRSCRSPPPGQRSLLRRPRAELRFVALRSARPTCR